MSNIELRRDHLGKVDMLVNGVPALGLRLTIMQLVDGEMTAFFAVPLKDTTFGESGKVLPFGRLQKT